MKKFFLPVAAFLCLIAVSCRQGDDVLSAEDIATIKIIEANRNDDSSNSDQNFKVDSTDYVGNSHYDIDGEIQAPPRK